MFEIIIPFFLLFFFLLIGMPVAMALGVSGGIGLLMSGGIDSFLGIFQATPYSSVASYSLVVVPMFVLMAEFLSESNIIKDLFKAANKWLSFLPGGLAIATVFAGGLFGALSGSSTASAATLSSASAPQMVKSGYSRVLAMGAVSISGTLSILIPPSNILIVYGIITETPIDKLFIAGIIPGIITGFSFVLVIILWAIIFPKHTPSLPKTSFKDKLISLKLLWPIVLLLFLVLLGIYTGAVTLSESAALAAFGALIIPLFMGLLNLKKIHAALLKALKTTTMIFTIIISGHIFGYYLTITQITQKTISFIGVLDVSKWVIMTIFLIIYLILGFFMDQFAILLLTLPLTFPVAMSLGFNPVWFGVVVAKTAEIGLVTPPLGLNVFVASGAVGEDVNTAFKGVVPFILIDIIVLILLLIFPIIIDFLPNQMD